MVVARPKVTQGLDYHDSRTWKSAALHGDKSKQLGQALISQFDCWAFLEA
jgi:hypothetical protein